jgi:predicted nucleotidyltransferase
MDAIQIALAVLNEVRRDPSIDYRACFISGSHSRAARDPNSDLDIHVMHAGDWWQLRPIMQGGIRVELLLEPMQLLRVQLAQGSRFVATELVDCLAVDDPHGIISALKVRAREILTEPPPRSPPGLEVMPRHRALSLLDDAKDLLAENDNDGVAYVLSVLVDRALTSYVRQRYGPRDVKRRYRTLRDMDSDIHRLYLHRFRSLSPEDMVESARSLIDLVHPPIGDDSTAATGRVPWQVALAYLR